MSERFDGIYELVERLGTLMAEKGLHSVEVDEGELSVSLRRERPQRPRDAAGLAGRDMARHDGAGRGGHFPAGSSAHQGDGAGRAHSVQSPDITNIYTDPSIKEVESPMVGVFYDSPSPDAEPYVRVGDEVSAGDVLCIVEAMKLMNEITAERAAVIEEVCVSNEDIVDVGMPLFKVREV
jgi:acetyl-CoA carboxylase biotin carboxyl carrier protein